MHWHKLGMYRRTASNFPVSCGRSSWLAPAENFWAPFNFRETGIKRLRAQAGRWTRRTLDSSHALTLLFFLSFCESIVVPIPIEFILVPYMVAKPERLWAAATVTLLGCIVGALFGYLVGYALFETVGSYVIETFGYEQAYVRFETLFSKYGFWAIIILGLLPIPFQTAMLGAGSVGYPIPLFLLATAIARGVRYFGLAWLASAFGDRARDMWQRNALLVSIGAAAVTLFVAVAVQWLASKLV